MDVHVSRISGEKLRGQITAVKDDHFSFTGKDALRSRRLQLREVRDVKRQHNKMGVALGILITSGIVLGIVVIAGATARD